MDGRFRRHRCRGVDPEGIVNVGGADWRARTNRYPVNAGDTIKVVAIDGITLEVEPLRERRDTGADGLRVDVQRLDPEMPLPAYAHPGDAGIDLHARESIVIPCGGGRSHANGNRHCDSAMAGQASCCHDQG